MYRPAVRTLLRSSQSSLAPARTLPSRRFVSTEPPHLRGRSWKNAALRWGIAVAGIYYYNTSPVFAEQPQHNLLNPNLEALDNDDAPSLDVLAARRKNRNAQRVHSAANALSSENAATSVSEQSIAPELGSASDSPQALEEEAESEGAFNPETGEINWDCPCLGGMAHGPCGPEFREAFSCFVFSSEEPKGMDCIGKFQGMRDCFQRHPDVYKDELMDDEEIDRELEQEKQELVAQIKERKDKEAAEAAAVGGQRRLLEEAPAEPRVKATRKVEQKEPQGAVQEQAQHTTTKAVSLPQQLSSDEKRREGEEADNIYEGQRSAVRKPSPPPVSEAADPVDELIPKAAYDAADARPST